MDKNRAKIIDLGVPKTRKIAKSMVLERPQHPQTPKLCGKRSISIIFPTKKKMFFLAKIIFSQYFWDFSTRQNPKIRDLTDPGICPSLIIIAARSIHQGFQAGGRVPPTAGVLR